MTSAGGVLLDTSFFMHLLDSNKEWNQHARLYMQFFMNNSWKMYLSTIVIAEWCVRGSIDELPLANLEIVPFNVSHGTRAGDFTRVALVNRQGNSPGERTIVKNDTKLFAQADLTKGVTHYLTSDDKSKDEMYDRVAGMSPPPSFKFISLCLPPEDTFAVPRPRLMGVTGDLFSSLPQVNPK